MMGMDFDYKGFMGKYRGITDPKQLKNQFKKDHLENKDKHEEYASLIMTLNHLLWDYYENGDEDTARIFDALWRKADSFAMNHFKGEQLQYILNFLD